MKPVTTRSELLIRLRVDLTHIDRVEHTNITGPDRIAVSTYVLKAGSVINAILDLDEYGGLLCYPIWIDVEDDDYGVPLTADKYEVVHVFAD